MESDTEPADIVVFNVFNPLSTQVPISDVRLRLNITK